MGYIFRHKDWKTSISNRKDKDYNKFTAVSRQLKSYEALCKKNGYHVTGTFGYQLTFYQREGFRVDSIDKDFFLVNYEKPIYEAGIQLQDMLRLVLEFDQDSG